jgi:hypothetical protein
MSKDSQDYPKLYFTDLPFEQALDPRVLRVWNLPQYEQRTPEWYEARKRCISASSIASALMQTEEACRYYIEHFNLQDSFVINPKKHCSYKESQLDLIMDKCGYGPGFKGNEFTLWGQKYEPVVSNIYSQMYQVDMLEFGLIFHPTVGFLAASPDGISTQGRMLEIKCPPCRDVKPYPPIYYFQQILMQLECTGLEECDYFDCHFVEYKDEEGWEEDARLWLQMNPDATHHIYGIILSYNEVVDGVETKKHIYPPPIVRTVDEFFKWAEEEGEKTDKDLEWTFYKLHEYYLSRVHASPEWFRLNYPVMEEVWKKIEYGRTPDGQASLEQIKRDKEEKRLTRRKKRKDDDMAAVFVDLACQDAETAESPVVKPKDNYLHTECLF